MLVVAHQPMRAMVARRRLIQVAWRRPRRVSTLPQRQEHSKTIQRRADSAINLHPAASEISLRLEASEEDMRRHRVLRSLRRLGRWTMDQGTTDAVRFGLE